MPSIQSTEQLTEGALYIFKGTATTAAGFSITNLVTKAIKGVMHAAASEHGLVFYSFDEVSETFNAVRVTAATGITASLASQAPFLKWEGVIQIPTPPTKETTLGKIIPTEEVSGLNFLNSYEDELTDI